MNAYRKISILVIACGVLLCSAGCQQQAKVATEPAAEQPAMAKAPPEGGPKIEFESLVYDFGKVGPGQKMPGQFKFTNTGDAPLKITKVQKCCGATTKLDKDELAPGESGILYVTYTSSRMAGQMSKKLYVESNDEQTPKATLTIKAETILKVEYEPKRLNLVLKEENAGCPKITLTSTDNQPFSITSFSSTSEALTADFDSTVQATKFVLEPKVDMEKVQKRRVGLIRIGLAYPEADAVPGMVSITYQMLSRFTSRPSTLVILYSDPTKPARKSLWITNNYGEDFEVESASSKEGYIKILRQSRSANRQIFSLEITPPTGEDVKRFSDTFTINLKGGETLEVPCRGIYRAPKPQAGQ